MNKTQIYNPGLRFKSFGSLNYKMEVNLEVSRDRVFLESQFWFKINIFIHIKN